MHFVYILKSLKDGGYYVGCTKDFVARLSCHNAGKTRSLKNRRPLMVVYTEQYESQTKAYIRELQIKSYHSGEAFKKLISKHYTPSGEIA